MRRHTPNFPKVLNLEIPIFRKVQRAIGIYQFGDPNLGEPVSRPNLLTPPDSSTVLIQARVLLVSTPSRDPLLFSSFPSSPPMFRLPPASYPFQLLSRRLRASPQEDASHSHRRCHSSCRVGRAQQHYIEYPIRPSSPIPKETYKRPVKGQQGSGESMSAKDQLTLDDYILPYIDDSDSDED